MKLAFCLHGISHGKNFKDGGQDVTYKSESELYKKNLLDKFYTSDTYFHTWNHDSIHDLLNIYMPKKYLVEESRIFAKPSLWDRALDKRRQLVFGRTELMRKNNIISRWYSFKKAVDLVGDSILNYDFIFIGRFDMSLLRPINFKGLKKNSFYIGNWLKWFDSKGEFISDQEVAKHSEKKYVMPVGFPFTNEGVHDFWFMASPQLMLEFSSIYSELDSLFKNSGYSSHQCALEKIKRMGLIDNIERVGDLYETYSLTRWL